MPRCTGFALALLSLASCAADRQPEPSWNLVRDETLHTELLLPSALPTPPALAIDAAGRPVVAVAQVEDGQLRAHVMRSDGPARWDHLADLPAASVGPHLAATGGVVYLLGADEAGAPALYRLADRAWEPVQTFDPALSAGQAALATTSDGSLHALFTAGGEVIHAASSSAWSGEPLGDGYTPSIAWAAPSPRRPPSPAEPVWGPPSTSSIRTEASRVGAIAFDDGYRTLRFLSPGAAPETVALFSDGVGLRERLRTQVGWGASGPRVLGVRGRGSLELRELVLYERAGDATWSERVLFADPPQAGPDSCPAATGPGDVCHFDYTTHGAGAALGDGLLIVQEDVLHGSYVWTCGDAGCGWTAGPSPRIEGALLVGDPDRGFTRVQPAEPFGGGELSVVRVGDTLHVLAYAQQGFAGQAALRYLELQLTPDLLTPASCGAGCADGATRCGESGVEVCQADCERCTHWVSIPSCPEGTACDNGMCREPTVTPPPGSLWADCSADEECDSGVCYAFWHYVGDVWTRAGGLCSFSMQGLPGDTEDTTCAPLGGTWYMPGCVTSYCLPDCDSGMECRAGLTCGHPMEWNPTACGYW